MKRSIQTKNEEAEHQLYEAVALIKTAEEAQMFLQDLCTPAELQAMADRWLVVKPITEGVAYRKITEKTGVSATTVGRVARCIGLGSGGYKLIFKRYEKKHHANKNQNSNSKKGKTQ